MKTFLRFVLAIAVLYLSMVTAQYFDSLQHPAFVWGNGIVCGAIMVFILCWPAFFNNEKS